MRVTTDDGVELEVHVAGRGPGLMLVHGFGGSKEDFHDHLSVLGAGHTVVTFDHRGHGASDKPATVDAYSLARLEADVLTVADALGLDEFRLLGHSMGGMLARGIVLRRPERVAALVLMDTAPGPIPGFDPTLMEAAADVALRDGKAALKELLDLAPALDTPAHLRLLAERPGYQEFCDRKWADLSEIMWAAMARALANQPDELDALGDVSCPTLVIVGEQDEPFVAVSRTMAATIPGARLAVIPDAGHSPQMENPDAWSAALTGFLASLPVAR